MFVFQICFKYLQLLVNVIRFNYPTFVGTIVMLEYLEKMIYANSCVIFHILLKYFLLIVSIIRFNYPNIVGTCVMFRILKKNDFCRKSVFYLMA